MVCQRRAPLDLKHTPSVECLNVQCLLLAVCTCNANLSSVAVGLRIYVPSFSPSSHHHTHREREHACSGAANVNVKHQVRFSDRASERNGIGSVRCTKPWASTRRASQHKRSTIVSGRWKLCCCFCFFFVSEVNIYMCVIVYNLFGWAGNLLAGLTEWLGECLYRISPSETSNAAPIHFSINSVSLDNEISFFFISFFEHIPNEENFSLARSAPFRK